MSRMPILTILALAIWSHSALGAGRPTCETVDAYMENVSQDEALSQEQKDQLTAELQRADAMCKDGKTEEAEKVLREADNEWARAYFTDMMDSGH